jgi:hypothetical protein
MPRQKGIFKVKGTMGDTTFYKTTDGYMLREKGGVSASRIQNDPRFQRTRENGAEFGRACKAGKQLRVAFRSLYLETSDTRMVSRLTQLMTKVVQSDAVHGRGQRDVMDGTLGLLVGFEFNIRGKLSVSLFAPFGSTIDRVSGELGITLDSFVPKSMVIAPSGTTHFRILSGGAEVDFENGNFVFATDDSGILPWTMTPTATITLVNQVTAASTLPLFLALGVEYYQEINGEMYPLKNGSHNPLCIIKVDQAL